MRKLLPIFIVLMLTCLCLNQLPVFSKNSEYFKDYVNYKPGFEPQTVCTYSKNLKSSVCTTNSPLFTDIIPNPVMYWYGTSTGDEPILLLNFSAGIPIRWLTDENTSDLDSIVLVLKLKPELNPNLGDYYYKILKIQGEPIVQAITYKPENTTEVKAEPSYNGASAGSISYQLKNAMEYNANKSIITFSGVSSDTLTIMIRKGKRYPINNCQIRVSMLVRVIKKDPKSDIKAIDFYNRAIQPCNDFKFDKTIIQSEEKPLFVKRLPLIAKIIVVPIVKLIYPTTYDVKIIKPGEPDENLFVTSRITKGSHVDREPGNNDYNCILNNGTVHDDDILYKEMGLPYKMEEKMEEDENKKKEEEGYKDKKGD